MCCILCCQGNDEFAEGVHFANEEVSLMVAKYNYRHDIWSRPCNAKAVELYFSYSTVPGIYGRPSPRAYLEDEVCLPTVINPWPPVSYLIGPIFNIVYTQQYCL